MSCSNLFLDLIVHKIHSISELSTADFINFVGQYNHALTGGREQIDSSLSSRGYAPEVLEATKKRASALFQPVTSCGLRFTKHLSNFKYPLFGYALSLFENYEKGLLPFEGPVADQPAQVMDLFGLIQNIKAEQQTKQLERAKRNGRQQRKDSARTR